MASSLQQPTKALIEIKQKPHNILNGITKYPSSQQKLSANPSNPVFQQKKGAPNSIQTLLTKQKPSFQSIVSP